MISKKREIACEDVHSPLGSKSRMMSLDGHLILKILSVEPTTTR